MKIGENVSVPSSQSSVAEQKQKTEAVQFEAALKKAAESGDSEALKKVCQDFESIFVQILMKNMRSTVPEGLMEKSQGESIFEGMLDEEFSKRIASAGGIGIADILYQQLDKKYGKHDEEKPVGGLLDSKG